MEWKELLLTLLSPALTLGVLTWWRSTDKINQKLENFQAELTKFSAAVNEFRVELAELRGASHKHTSGAVN